MRNWLPALQFVVFILSASEALAVQKEEGIVKIQSPHSVAVVWELSKARKK